MTQQNEYTNRYIWTDSVWDAPQDYKFVSGKDERDGNYMLNFFYAQPALNFGFNKITESWQLSYTHPDCLATREAIKDIMRFWLDNGCDGFRVDMASSLVKNDDDKTATGQIWTEIRQMLDNEYPEAALVSEWSNPQQSLKCGFHCDFYLNEKGNGYYSLFRNKDEKTGEQLSFFSSQGKGDIRIFVDEYLKMYNSSKKDGYISIITGNHDTARIRRYLDETELKLAYAFIFTMPGVPFLYYGDEIGMRYIENLVSKEAGYNRTGARTPMQWSKSENAGFSEASCEKIYLPVDDNPDAPNVENQINEKDSLLNIVKDVVKLRHDNESLQADGCFDLLYAESGKYPLVYRRGDFVIAVNPSNNIVSAPVAANGSVVYSIGGEADISDINIKMAPQSFVTIKI
jgi:maltose alpha-D-glucosyltransferase/alpha-amylase